MLGYGAADVKPITTHLYKTQIYQLAAHLGIPVETFDLCLYAEKLNHYALKVHSG